MKTLIVGCSFCATLGDPTDTSWCLSNQITVAATAGSGNTAIAARVVYECSRQHYDRVIVLWSGINRLDCVIPVALHETYPGALERRPDYSFCTPMGNQVWYHSGGIAGSWQWDKTCPTEIKNWFRIQYLGADRKYLNDLSLQAVVTVQSFLESQGIEYHMSWIYDIYKNYQDQCLTATDRRLEHFFGHVMIDSPLYQKINWAKIHTDSFPYEWAIQHSSRLENDGFHPTRLAMRNWILDNFKLDIAA